MARRSGCQTQSIINPTIPVVPTASLTLSVNVSGFGVTKVTEVGSDDDVAMEFSNLTLVLPRLELSDLSLENASVLTSLKAACGVELAVGNAPAARFPDEKRRRPD